MNLLFLGTTAVASGVVEGTKAVGSGVVEGTKVVGETVVSGGKAVGSGVVQGTKAVGTGVAVAATTTKDLTVAAGNKVSKGNLVTTSISVTRLSNEIKNSFKIRLERKIAFDTNIEISFIDFI